MGLLNVELTAPNGFWSTIIFGLEGAVKNYALALILITIIIKLVMVPFDFLNRYTSKKSSRKQAEMKPELDKINAKYANDKNMLNQKTMEVYKSHNFNIMGTCLGMLVYLILTMVVFWTLFGSLNTISSYKIGDQYLQVRDSFYAVYGIEEENVPEGSTLYAEWDKLTDDQKAEKQTQAHNAVKEKYEETKVGFLWIENIWLADTTVDPVMTYKDFISKSGIAEDQISQEEYDMIIAPLADDYRGNNGFYILAILAAGLNFLSMTFNGFISKLRAKKKGLDPKLVGNNSNKIMSIVMPLIMGLFTLFYNAAFGLYIVAGALITLITSPLITLFVDMLEIDAISREKNKYVAIYDRKRK